MARELFDRAYSATVPNDLRDPPRFSQIHETTKDVIVLELRKFFANAQQSSTRRAELPTIEKYATFSDANDPFSSAVEIVRKHPDKLEKLPHVAVLTTSGAEKKLSIGPPYVATVQDPPRITAALAEPYAFADGDTFHVRTKIGPQVYLEKIQLYAEEFPTANPITAALAVDVVRVYNGQALYTRAFVVQNGDDDDVIELRAGASPQNSGNPSEISLDYGTSENICDVTELGFYGNVDEITVDGLGASTLTIAEDLTLNDVGGLYLTVIGTDKAAFNDGRFLISDVASTTVEISNKYGRAENPYDGVEYFIGQRDTHLNTLRPPKHRYAQSADLALQIDVICDDENTRGELADLVFGFFSFWLEKKFFQFLGRSDLPGQGSNGLTTGEFYQIVIRPPFRSSGEAEIPRPTDGSDKVYINSFSLDVTTTMFIDRELYFPGTTPDTNFIVSNANLEIDEDFHFPQTE